MLQKTTKAISSSSQARTIGLDSHPDTFTAGLLLGHIPSGAITEKIFNRVPVSELVNWANKHTTPQDLFVLEASGNSFQIVRTLATINRRAVVLESRQLGQLKEAHANNDKISAVRIAKAYLAGTAKTVWVPDVKTQERRDCWLAYTKSVKRTTQMVNRIQSYLSDNGVRLPSDHEICWKKTPEIVAAARSWSPCQQMLLRTHFEDLQHAVEKRQQWQSLIAEEVINDPVLLSLVRLCGVRDIGAFAIGAIIGDIERFSDPKKLVNYIGLSPAFDESGEGRWRGGIGRHGRKDLRAQLIQGAQAILRTDHPLGKWGRRLLARKGEWNLVVGAVARKLAVAIWYLLKGRWTTLEEIDAALNRKIGKILTHIGEERFQAMGRKRSDLRAEALERLKSGRIYLLGRHTIVIQTTPNGQSTASSAKATPSAVIKTNRTSCKKNGGSALRVESRRKG